MHKLAKEIMDRVKSKINACGIDGITEQELIEMKYWTCVADSMASFDYHFKIIEEMEKPENQYGVTYDENGRIGKSSHKGYSDDMMPMYYRDMDMRNGRMYYSEVGGMNGNNSGIMSSNGGSNTNRGYSERNYGTPYRNYEESRYERARRGYEEAKSMNPSSDNSDKIEEIFEELDHEMKELKPKMTQSEKNLARTKLSSMANNMM